MKIKKEYFLREIDGEYVIIPVGEAAERFDGLFTMNEVGASIWKLLGQEMDFEELVTAIRKEYDVEESVAREDIQDFLNRMRRNGMLEE